MTRIGRVGRGRRRPDLAAPSHERARQRAAERLDGPLEPAESAWLAEHLATCEPCQTVATAYEADRLALRELRATPPEPPRDLWARTAAAIEREASHGAAGRRVAATTQTRFRPALGIASAVAVIAVVIGATVLSGGFTRTPSTAFVPTTTASGSVTAPGPTPIIVGAGSVGWVGTSDNGALAYNITPVSEVCPPREIDCARDVQKQTSPVTIDTRPKSIIQSPGGGQAVVFGTDTAGGTAVIVIALPTATPTGTPAPTATPTATPAISSASTDPPSSPPATPVVTASATPEPTPSPTPTTEATPSPTPTALPTPTATAPVTPSPTPEITPTPTPIPTPQQTAATTLAIVSGVTVVGQSAAYSPDGRWFAFTARPADDSAGPDIYLWQVGAPLAKKVTDDHASVFASWVDTRMLGSRPNPDATGSAGAASSFFMDPETGTETPIAGAEWRPVVDPTGKWVVAWEGSVKPAPDGLTTVPSDGALVLRKYMSEAGPDVTEANPPTVAKGAFSDFDVRWDSTGTWIAVWVADPAHPTIGRLSLLHLDPQTGKLSRPAGGPDDVPALPGISIAKGRLAWATPPGQEGEGSRVQIVAWSGDTVGSTESDPVTNAIVVH